jgi:hypothetical protein
MALEDRSFCSWSWTKNRTTKAEVVFARCVFGLLELTLLLMLREIETERDVDFVGFTVVRPNKEESELTLLATLLYDEGNP